MAMVAVAGWLLTVGPLPPAAATMSAARSDARPSTAPVTVTVPASGEGAAGGGANSLATGTNIITTAAGGIRPGPSDPRQTVVAPTAVAVTTGSVFAFDKGSAVVRAVDRNGGPQQVVAGNGLATISGDGGPALDAGIQYVYPEYGMGLAVDGQGRLLVVSHKALRRVAADGTISTVATGDVLAVTTDLQGRALYTDGCVVRRVESDDTITLFAGTGECTTSGDGGPAVSAGITAMSAIAVSPMGDTFLLSDAALMTDGDGLRRVRKVAADGTISTYAASISVADVLAVDLAGRPLVAQSNVVNQVAPGGALTPVAGGGSSTADGVPATSAQLGRVTGLAVDGMGTLVIGGPAAVRQVAGGVITTVLGVDPSTSSVPPQPAAQSQLGAGDVAVTRDGDILVADGRLRRVSRDGIVTTITTVGTPISVAPAPDGTIYYLNPPAGSSSGWTEVRRLSPNGADALVIAGVSPSATGPVPVPNAGFSNSTIVRLDGSGRLYVGDRPVCYSAFCATGGALRRVELDGSVTLLLSYPGGSFQGGMAPWTAFSGVMAVEPDGTIYYATAEYNGVARGVYRRWPDGTTTLITGVPGGSSVDGGPAIESGVFPSALAIDPTSGALYLSEPHRVWKLSEDHTISTVARNPLAGPAPPGDGGSAQSAGFEADRLAVGWDGRVVFTDELGVAARVRAVSPAAPPSTMAAPVVTPGVGSVQVSWSPPAQSDLVVTGYVIVGSAGAWSVSVGQVTSTRVDGLANGTAYSFQVMARSAAGFGAPSPWSAPVTPVAGVVPGAGFHAVTPYRVLDTRTPLGGLDGAVAAGAAWVTVAPSGGPGGVPASASAVVMNVAVTGGTLPSVLRVWPNGFPGPTAANLNFGAGETIANLVTVKVGSGGQVLLGNLHGSVHVIADVVGWYDDGSGGGDGFTGMTPARLLDSRTDVGGWGSTPLGAGDANVRSLVVRGGATGVPGTASSVALNVTVTGGSAGSYLQVFPTGAARPVGANINFGPGQTIPNLVVMKVGSGDRVSLFNAVGSTDVVVDVVGYFDPTVTGGRFHPVVPTRVIDSRDGTGGFSTPWPATPPATALAVTLAGVGPVPANATGVVVNTAVTQGTSASYLTVFPDGVTQPGTANVVFAAGQTIPNAVLVGLGAGGGIQIANQLGTVHVVGDLDGYYAPT